MMKTTMFVLAASVVPAYAEEASSSTQWCARSLLLYPSQWYTSLPDGIDDAYCQRECFWNNVLRTNLCKQDQENGSFEYYHYCIQCQPISVPATSTDIILDFVMETIMTKGIPELSLGLVGVVVLQGEYYTKERFTNPAPRPSYDRYRFYLNNLQQSELRVTILLE